MDFTFGIITDGKSPERLATIFKSIEAQQFPNYEIVVVGGNNIVRENVVHVPFEETTPKAWITRKKNLITEHASYENVVYMHDYFALDEDWAAAWKPECIDPAFDVAVTYVWMQADGSNYRHADWVVNPYDYWKVFPDDYWKNWDVGLPYVQSGFNKVQYISGGFWVAKRDFMKRFPLDETLFWGDSEDCRWSETARQHTTFQHAPAITWCLKTDKWKVNEMPRWKLEKVAEHFGIEYDAN
jgi:hypothetical protein